MVTLLKTIHGSHLYGMAHKGSDLDRYIVVEGDVKTKQIIRDGVDTTIIGLHRFLLQCDKGVPQALEAMFSTLADPGPLDTYRRAFRVGGEFRDTYTRTIRDFVERGGFKRRRHALRLMINMEDALRHGFFNPTLTPGQVEEISYYARSVERTRYALDWCTSEST